MSKFNFKSQPCTSREQSKRLLALGIKKETADCGHFYGRIEHEEYEDWETIILDDYGWESHWDVTDEDIPAWSLYRLTEMMPMTMEDRICHELWDLNITPELVIYRNQQEPSEYIEQFSGQGVYNNIIDCIECLIKEGYFNEEYLG